MQMRFAHIDRHFQMCHASFAPTGRNHASTLEHPIAKFFAQTMLLHQLDEFSRRDQSLFGMAPANQGFSAHYTVAVNVNFRLVVQFQLATLRSTMKFAAQCHFLKRLQAELR